MRAFFAEGLFETQDGEKLTLVCDLSTIDVAEQITGLNWDRDIIPQMIDPPKALAVKLLYSLLRKRQVNVTLDEAAGLTYDQNSIVLWAIVGDVIRRACNLGEAEEEEEPAKKKSPGRSKASAASG
jgi:hypothetical protein